MVGVPVHRVVEHLGLSDAAGAQTSRESCGFPMALGRAHAAALASWSASVAPSHGDGGCRFVDEHEAVRIEIGLPLEPRLTGSLHVRPGLLDGVAGAFSA